MKKRFDKIIKIFFALAMIFSQMYSPLSVFAETVDDTLSGDSTSDSDVTLEEDTDTTFEVTEDTNTDDESLDEEDDQVDLSNDDTTLNEDENLDNNENLNEDKNLDDNDDNTDLENKEENTDNLDDTTDTGGDTTGENNDIEEENTDSEVASLDIGVEGNVELVSSEGKTYTYNVLTSLGNLNVKFNPIISNTESNVVDLVINDTYTITDDFSFDFAKLAGGTYKFTFNLYEGSDVVDTVVVNVNSDRETEEDYYVVNQGTTLEELAYKFVSATLDSSSDTKKMLSDYLTMNCDLDVWFDSEEGILGVRYGSTTNNVTTIGDLINDISNTIGATPESSEDDDETIYTGLEITVTFMGEEITYTVVALGDTDTDYVTESDVQDILDFALENKELDPYSAKASDVNEDGIVNVWDVTNVIKGIRTDSFEIPENDDEYSISLSGRNNVKVGDTVTINLEVSGFNEGKINGIEGELVYDDSILELTGISSGYFEYGTLNSDNNRFMFTGFEGLDKDAAVITFEFNAKKAGNAVVSVEGVGLALDGAVLNLGENSASLEVKVEDTEEDTSNQTTAPVVQPMSNNYVVQYVDYSVRRLVDNIIIKGYEINFDPKVHEYTINVGSDVDSLDLTTILADPNATYEVIGNENFKEGENTVTIVATDPDGNTETYTIKVNKEKSKAKVDDEKDSSIVKTIVIGLIILVIIGLVYLIFKDDESDNEEYSPKNKNNNKKKK